MRVNHTIIFLRIIFTNAKIILFFEISNIFSVSYLVFFDI